MKLLQHKSIFLPCATSTRLDPKCPPVTTSQQCYQSEPEAPSELRTSWLLYGPGPFGKFVLEVHGGLGLGGSPRPARVAVARVVLQTLTGVGTRGVETLGMTATQVSTVQTLVLIWGEGGGYGDMIRRR
jgi:hypothetical protein